MQLRVARLCLDCEEIHDQLGCPICSSESFAYITRWIPQVENAARQRPTPTPTPSREAAETYRELIAPTAPASACRRWAKRGAVVLGAIGLASWAWRQTAPNGGQAGTDDRKGSNSSAEPSPKQSPQK
jgi:hypothetical protein